MCIYFIFQLAFQTFNKDIINFTVIIITIYLALNQGQF